METDIIDAMSVALGDGDASRGTELLREFGISSQFASQIRYGTRKVPPLTAIKIERRAEGRITKEQIRPDFDWIEMRVRESAA